MKQALPILIAIMALVGISDSVYLSLDHYGYITSQGSISQQICELRSNTCGQVLHSEEASVFGIPSSILGIGYFALLFAAATTRIATGWWPSPALFMALVAGGLAFSGYLVYMMVFNVRQICPYCLTAHAANAALALLYAASARIAS